MRLVCQELESWYLGDLHALECAYPESNVNTERNRKRYSNPDKWEKPSKQIGHMVRAFQKFEGARKMAQYLVQRDNSSKSFQAFLQGIERIVQEMEGDRGRV